MPEKSKVLLIDDEVDFTELLAANLTESGFEVEQLNDPTKAVEVASRFRPDVCLIDLVMPQMDGGDVVNAFKAAPKLRGMPVVMLTALVEEDPDANGAAQMRGGLPFISKTSDLWVIEKAINDRIR